MYISICDAGWLMTLISPLYHSLQWPGELRRFDSPDFIKLGSRSLDVRIHTTSYCPCIQFLRGLNGQQTSPQIFLQISNMIFLTIGHIKLIFIFSSPLWKWPVRCILFWNKKIVWKKNLGKNLGLGIQKNEKYSNGTLNNGITVWFQSWLLS